MTARRRDHRPPPPPRPSAGHPVVAALLVVVLAYGLLLWAMATIGPSPADAIVDRVRDRLGDPAATVTEDPAGGCREVLVVDEYGAEMPIRDCD